MWLTNESILPYSSLLNKFEFQVTKMLSVLHVQLCEKFIHDNVRFNIKHGLENIWMIVIAHTHTHTQAHLPTHRHTHTHTHTQTHSHTHKHTNTHRHTFPQTHTYTHTDTLTHTNTHTNTPSHTQTHTHTHTYTHTDTLTHTHTQTHTQTHTHTHTCTHTHTDRHIHTHTHTETHKHTHTQTHTHRHTLTHADTHTHTHTQRHTHTNTHTQTHTGTQTHTNTLAFAHLVIIYSLAHSLILSRPTKPHWESIQRSALSLWQQLHLSRSTPCLHQQPVGDSVWRLLQTSRGWLILSSARLHWSQQLLWPCVSAVSYILLNYNILFHLIHQESSLHPKIALTPNWNS